MEKKAVLDSLGALAQETRLDIFLAAGFVTEGEIKNRIRNIDGSFADSVLLAWFNPNFEK